MESCRSLIVAQGHWTTARQPGTAVPFVFFPLVKPIQSSSDDRSGSSSGGSDSGSTSGGGGDDDGNDPEDT
jgi:uncharacterized membrane protein YgcG